MARPERYDPEQWVYMNQPYTQARIREELKKYVRCFLDTAPEGSEKSRVREVFLMVKKYFERELRLAEESPEPERSSIAEDVLMGLASYIRIQDQFEVGLSSARAAASQHPELSPEETDKQIEDWRRFEEKLREQGKEHWWD